MGESVVELAVDFGNGTSAGLSCTNDSVFRRLSDGYCDTSTEPALDAIRVVRGIFEFLVVSVELERTKRTPDYVTGVKALQHSIRSRHHVGELHSPGTLR